MKSLFYLFVDSERLLRLFKFTLLMLLLLAVTLVGAFFARAILVQQTVNHYLAQYHSNVSCLAFNFTRELNVVIEKLCIESPYADLTIEHATFDWNLSSAQLFNRVIKLNNLENIAIESLSITGRKAFTLNGEHGASSSYMLNSIPQQMQEYLNIISAYSLDSTVQVKEFTYQPFILEGVDESKSKSPIYHGTMLADNQQLILSLLSENKAPILAVNLVPITSGFEGQVNANIASVIELLQIHNMVLPRAVIAKESVLVGSIATQWHWQKNRLTVNAKINDFLYQPLSTLTKPNSLSQLMTVKGNLYWQMNLVDEVLTLNFEQELESANKMTHQTLSQPSELVVKHQGLNEYLSSAQLPQWLDDILLGDLLTHNDLSELSITPQGSMRIDFSQQKIITETLTLRTKTATPFTLELTDAELIYQQEESEPFNLSLSNSAQLAFSLATQLSLAMTQSFSHEKVSINAYGQLKQNDNEWQLLLAPETKLQLANLSFSSVTPTEKDKEAQANNSANTTKISQLISHWQGRVTLNNNKQVILALQNHNQVKQLRVAQILQFNEANAELNIQGGLENININGAIHADKVPLGQLQVSGNIETPLIELNAENIMLTDLLALKVKLPVALNLIDGRLSYQLNTQLTSLQSSSMVYAPITVDLSVQDMTGELDGLWLQELNWQQRFLVEHQKITTQPHSAYSKKANLSIAKIEAATPITNLVANVNIDFQEDQLSGSIVNANGNIVGGKFSIKKALWPLQMQHSVDIQLESIDLETLLELDKKQGIVVTGKVSGNLPLYTDGNKFFIEAGELYNVDDGVIQVFNNPAVEELKASSLELKLAFGALENLHYHYLYSAVSMGDDGYMLLDTVIKGRNPDLENDVNLNLNLSYDLLGLLESLTITDSLESNMINGLQKN
ncbi:hypothetical protein GCM10009111_09570 [Colwellia asteriadis]|uniref:Dicarboxylate transport domain-containing protein n=1 Tax=Colwellia asteriadis TaxID=517723 RepID=A0ABN1L4M6_9GAMM